MKTYTNICLKFNLKLVIDKTVQCIWQKNEENCNSLQLEDFVKDRILSRLDFGFGDFDLVQGDHAVRIGDQLVRQTMSLGNG